MTMRFLVLLKPFYVLIIDVINDQKNSNCLMILTLYRNADELTDVVLIFRNVAIFDQRQII